MDPIDIAYERLEPLFREYAPEQVVLEIVSRLSPMQISDLREKVEQYRDSQQKIVEDSAKRLGEAIRQDHNFCPRGSMAEFDDAEISASYLSFRKATSGVEGILRCLSEPKEVAA